MEIPRCTAIGFLENLKNKCFEEIYPVDEVKLEEKLSEDKPLPKPLQTKEKINFLAGAKIPVPQDMQQNYEDLIAKHHDVFSTDKNYLGRGTNFEHKIDLKNQNPTYRKQFPIPEVFAVSR